MVDFLLSALSLSASAFAGLLVPDSNNHVRRQTCSNLGTPMVATFDDVPGSNPLTSSINSLGVYKNISWTGFEDLCLVEDALSVIPNTGTCQAAGGALTVSTVAAGEDLEITIDYPGSAFGCFDVSSLYFGCAIPAKNPVVAPVTSCAVRFAGYDREENRVAQQTVNFDVNVLGLGLQANPQLVKFGDDFKGLTRLAFFIRNKVGDLLTVATAIEVDTVSFTLREQGDACCQA